MNRMIVFALAAAALAAAGCQGRTSAQERPLPKPPEGEVWVTPKQIREAAIATTEVAMRPIGDSLTTTGRIAFSDARVSHVFSPVTGRVSRLFVNVGDHVGRGTPLALLQSPDIGGAASDLAKAEADLAAARRDHERQKELFEGHAAAQRDFEAAESLYRKAQAERDRAARKTKLFGSDGSSQEFILRAPIDGEVVARAVSPGMEVQGQYSGGSAAELFTIGSIDAVQLFADVFEIDLPRVHAGAPVTVSVLPYPDHPFHGTIDWISGALDPVTRSAKVRCTITNGDHRLRPEMYATVSIGTDATSKLAVPRTAVLRLGDQMVAYVDKGAAPGGGERYERRIVAVDDAEASDYVPVVRGLAPGEKVVSSGVIVLTGSTS